MHTVHIWTRERNFIFVSFFVFQCVTVNVRSLKCDMFELKYRILFFCLNPVLSYRNNKGIQRRVTPSPTFPHPHPQGGRKKHLSATFSSEELYMQQGVCLQWQCRQDVNQSNCFTPGVTSHRVYLALVGEWIRNLFIFGWILSEWILWDNIFPNIQGTKAHAQERGRNPLQHGSDCLSTFKLNDSV